MGSYKAITQESVAVWAPLLGLNFGWRTGPYQTAHCSSQWQDEQQPTSMEIDLVGQGKKGSKGKKGGKSKGEKGDGKSKSGKGKDAYGKSKSWEKGKNGKGKGVSHKGKGKGDGKDKTCFTCGGYGHLARDCWQEHQKPQVEQSYNGSTTSFFSCVCLMASMARSVNCLIQKKREKLYRSI